MKQESVVGVIIAGIVLLPEGLAAFRAAKNDQIQTSLNLAFGSALASIGLSIPAIAIISVKGRVIEATQGTGRNKA